MREFRWKDIQTGAMLTKLHPDMLSELGHCIFAAKLTKGERRQAGRPPMRKFIFDKDFVLQWLASRVIIPLGMTNNVDSLIEVIKEACEVAKVIEKEDIEANV